MNELEHTSYEHTEGENRPISNARLAVLVLLGAEIMFFAGLIGTFLVFRFGSVTWPPPSQADVRLPIGVTGLNTIVLLLSGYTMFQGLRAIRQDRQKELRNWLFATGLLGVIFLIVQGSEWVRLVHHGFYTFIGSIRLSLLCSHRLSRLACFGRSPLAASRFREDNSRPVFSKSLCWRRGLCYLLGVCCRVMASSVCACILNLNQQEKRRGDSLMICRYFLLIVGVTVLALLIPAVAEACPSCKTIDDPIVQGFKWSILFLMAMPYIVAGLIGGGVFYVYYRSHRADNRKPPSNLKGV